MKKFRAWSVVLLLFLVSCYRIVPEDVFVKKAFERLDAIAEIKTGQLQDFFSERACNIETLAKSKDVEDAITLLDKYRVETGVGDGEDFETETPRYQEIHERIKETGVST